jgi:hypothetical protein
MAEGTTRTWELKEIGDTVWLASLEGDEPRIYWYSTKFLNFVRAPLYEPPPGALRAPVRGGMARKRAARSRKRR